MSKDKKPVAPVTTNLQKPTPENPLIVDLPDGQKLVIGQLADGSIIEIATWRGTGRPDSRTSRLMLGMANGKPVQQTQGEDYEKQAEQKAKSPADFLNQVKGNFSGLVSRFAGPTHAEKLVEEEVIAPKVEEIDSEVVVTPKKTLKKSSGKIKTIKALPKSEKSKNEEPVEVVEESLNNIRSAGASFISRMKSERKSPRRFKSSKHDPVAAEVDLWLQNILRDAAVKANKPAKPAKPAKKSAAASAKAKKSTQSRTSAKKSAPSSAKSKKR